jgi:hypothetical protein
LLFPPEVLSEIKRGSGAIADQLLAWARDNSAGAQQAASLDTVKAVLREVSDVLDPHAAEDQADPYVLALALDRRGLGLYDVTIVTDDRRDKPGKLSLATAAGILNLPTVPLHAFLRMERLSP